MTNLEHGVVSVCTALCAMTALLVSIFTIHTSEIVCDLRTLEAQTQWKGAGRYWNGSAMTDYQAHYTLLSLSSSNDAVRPFAYGRIRQSYGELGTFEEDEYLIVDTSQGVTLHVLEPPWEGEDVSAIVRNTLHGRRCDVHVTYTAPLHERSGELHFAVADLVRYA